MIKDTLKRLLKMALCAVLVCTLSPTPSFAAQDNVRLASLGVPDLGVSSTSGDGIVWALDGNYIKGEVTGKAASGCDSASSTTSTMTLTNNKETAATLSFDFTVTLNSGTVTIDGVSKSANDTFSKEIDAGSSVKVVVTSAASASTTSIEMSNIKLLANVQATTIFVPSENGTYTVDGEAVDDQVSKTKNAFEGYQLKASPNDGFKFFGWYSGETLLSRDSETMLYFDSNTTITAKFVSATAPTFDVDGTKFFDLNAAVSYAQGNGKNKITLVEDGTLESGNYTIPSGITLLIPFDAANTLYTDTPVSVKDSAGTAKAYRTLTMAEGSSLTVNGAISVGGQYKAAAGSSSGSMTGNYGYIKMESGSNITVKNGGSLYAWGFVSGSGSVTAESGSSVYEWYQIMDFRGGTASSSMGNKVFPFSQYAVQNIEVPLTLYAGAKEVVYTGIYALSSVYPTSITFVGDNGMFKIVSGSLTKQYDGTTDRIIYTVNGQAEVNNLNLTLANQQVSSASYVLPLTNNMTVNLNSGSKMTINQDAALLAGVQANIASDAELLVSSGTNVYIYDADEWNANSYTCKGKFVSVQYAPSKTYNRSEANLVDAKVDVNGTLTAAGSIYTTAGGADICSSNGTGKYVQQGAPGTETTTYQYTQSSSSVTAHSISITAAKLHNADSSYTETANAKAGDNINYANGKWGSTNLTVTFDANEGEGTMDSQTIAASTDARLNPNTFTREGYTFTGWNTQADGTGTPYADGATINIDSNITLYAQWKINTYTVTWVNDDGTVLEKDENVAYGAAPAYNGATPTKEADAQYTYTFKGWDPEIGEDTKVTAGITYKAVYEKTVNKYDIVWKNWDGAQLKSEKVAYGEVPNYTGETPVRGGDAQHTYTFSGWTPEITEVAGNAEYTATFTDSINTYTVIWQNWDKTELQKDENVAYGTTPEYKGNAPTRDGDAQYSYTFNGWTPAVDKVTGDITYTATFEQTVNKYTVTWKNGDAVLKSEQVAYGDTPAYSGETPKNPDQTKICIFDGWDPEITAVAGDITYTAKFKALSGLYTDSAGDTWWLNDGVKELDKGLTRVQDSDGHNLYYYFGEDGKAVKGTDSWVEKTNGLLPQWGYVFDGNGAIAHDGAFQSGIQRDASDGKLYCYVDGIKVHRGMFEIDGDYYYARSSGQLVAGYSYYCERVNGLLPVGTYQFDADGRMVRPDVSKNGIVEEDGSLWYYVGGERSYAGLVQIDGRYYYVKTSGEVVRGKSYWITKTNGLLPEKSYAFADDGHIVFPDTSKSGIYPEDGSLYYYRDGARFYAGLVQIDGSYYYVRGTGEVVHGRSYWTTKTNGLLPEKSYTFADDGKMIVSNSMK